MSQAVRLLPLVRLHAALDVADRQAQPHVDGAHPLHVAAGQVVVDRDDVDALAGQGVQIGGQRGHQGFAFAGDHFGDVAGVQDHAADHLDVVMPHVQIAPAGLAAGGKRLGQQVVERFAGGQPLAELDGLLPQFVVGQGLELWLQGVDGVDLCL